MAKVLPNGIVFEIAVDWNGDNDFSDASEDITDYVKSAKWSIGMRGPYELMGDETSLDLLLENHTKRFTPENSSGPLYGYLLPHKKVRVRAFFNGTWYSLYLGWIDWLMPEGGSGRTCAIQCVGAKQQIQDQEVSLPLLTDVRSDEVIQAIIERLQLPPALGTDAWILGLPGNSELGESTYLSDLSPAISLDTGLLTFPYVADNWNTNFYGQKFGIGEDWEKPFKGYDAIEDVVKAERGRFFFDREGIAVFWARDRLQKDVTLDATFDNVHQDIDYRYGEDVVNKAIVNAYPRSVSGAASVLWQLDDTITLSASAEKTLSVKYAEQDSGKKVAGVNASVTSFTYTGNVEYSVEWLASGAKITFTNLDDSENTISAMVIQGKALTSYNKVVAQTIDGTSQAAYGQREWLIDSKLQSDAGLAQNIADYEISRRKDARGEVHSITIQAIDMSRITQILTRTVGDRIRVIDDTLEHDAEYFIVGEKHNWTLDDGYRVVWILEAGDGNHFWVLGESGFSELGETTWLGL